LQQLSLWDDRKPIRKRVKKKRPTTLISSYSITGVNDCEIIGHTIQVWDLSGCSICLDCNARIFCPRCIAAHPQDENAIPILCNQHEES
jgi:hypothetical protein